ncbi:MAG: hypothetical protein AB7R69_00950 [Candidatus Babeliales bacterium]
MNTIRYFSLIAVAALAMGQSFAVPEPRYPTFINDDGSRFNIRIKPLSQIQPESTAQSQLAIDSTEKQLNYLKMVPGYNYFNSILPSKETVYSTASSWTPEFIKNNPYITAAAIATPVIFYGLYKVYQYCKNGK